MVYDAQCVKRIVVKRFLGYSFNQIAVDLLMNVKTVRRLYLRWGRTGSFAITRGPRVLRSDAHLSVADLDWIVAMVETNPLLTMFEYLQVFKANRHQNITSSSLYKAMQV